MPSLEEVSEVIRIIDTPPAFASTATSHGWVVKEEKG
jgi:hypothetical protein